MSTNTNSIWGSEDPFPEQSQTSESFPDEWKDEFEGLLYLGYLQQEVNEIPFHKFVVKTLTINEKLEVSLITKPYLESIGYNRAYKAAIVAAGLVSVDGRELIPSNKRINIVKEKFNYIIDSWYDVVIDLLYVAIEELEMKVILVLQELDILKKPETGAIFVDETVEGNDNPKDGNPTLT